MTLTENLLLGMNIKLRVFLKKLFPVFSWLLPFSLTSYQLSTMFQLELKQSNCRNEDDRQDFKQYGDQNNCSVIANGCPFWTQKIRS